MNTVIADKLTNFPDTQPYQKLYLHNEVLHVDYSTKPIRTVLSMCMNGYCRKDVIANITQLSIDTIEYVKNYLHKKTMCIYAVKSYEIYNIISNDNRALIHQCDTMILNIIRIIQSLSNMELTYQHDKNTITALNQSKTRFASACSMLSHIKNQYTVK